MKRVAMICRFDNSGLGTLSWEFSRHLKPSKVLLVQNSVYQTFPERYADLNTRTVKPEDGMTDADKKWIADDVDVLISFETFYDLGLIQVCKDRLVKSVLVTMFEMTPDPIKRYPDLFLCPSKLDYDVFSKMSAPAVYIPVPVNTEALKWRRREKAQVFIHTASHGGISGRKGTALLLKAMEYVKSDIKLRIYTWQPIHNITKDPRIEIKLQNFKNYWQAWGEGDVLVYPQDYNGICLPVIEALSSGLGVISTNIYPFNEYLPKELLYEPIDFYETRAHMGLMKVQAARIDPKTIAAKIDEIAGADISRFSEYGREWAVDNSWEKLLPEYVKLIESL